ncbi:hypothetical protein CDAR_609161 [Caerostris darwini]|uniref:Uncharacterized protein n=1 Tax=Caerostris darwini TaxID=1538125 RepID=A0AAV4U416_9ARAC|nr:hypothetical protein CDAR_609161 [Caerostris darwini]
MDQEFPGIENCVRASCGEREKRNLGSKHANKFFIETEVEVYSGLSVHVGGRHLKRYCNTNRVGEIIKKDVVVVSEDVFAIWFIRRRLFIERCEFLKKRIHRK